MSEEASSGRGAEETSREISGQGDPYASPLEILDRLKASTRGSFEAFAPKAAGDEHIGRYVVQEEVARGGMGVIYRVHDPEMRRSLAMKILHGPGAAADAEREPSSDTKRSARFIEEAQVTGQLDHPGIVPVHELGLDSSGRLFFTMMLVKGRTLNEVFELVREGREEWTLTRALGVVLKVCEAMAFAHDRRVIHRDLKPANVMVGRFGEVFVMDWGLAKLLDRPEVEERQVLDFLTHTILTSERKDESGRDSDSSLETMEGDVMGTPSYMSPEQAQGRIEQMGPRSDVYSAGAILYHLLAGQPPYVKPGTKVDSRTILKWVIDGPPEPVDEIARDVPLELAAVCQKAMARDPEARYASMLDMAHDLRAYLEHRVVRAYSTGAAAELRKWVERNRGLAASLAIALLAALGALAGVSFVQTRSKRDLAQAYGELQTTNSALEEANRRVETALRTSETNEVEARWQSYVANITAAGANLDGGAAQSAAMLLTACEEEHRNWEWRYLQNRVDSSLSSILASEESFVTGVAFSPDGRYLASCNGNIGTSGGADFAVRIWRADTGQLVHELEGHSMRCVNLAFSPSGTELASGGWDDVRLWDVESGEQLVVRPGLGSKIAFHPDGLRLAAGADEGYVRVWNSLTDEVVLDLDLPKGEGVRCVVISPDGRLVAAGSYEYRVRVWEIETGDLVQEVDLSAEQRFPTAYYWFNGVLDLQFSPDGDKLVAALSNRNARVLDLETGATKAVLAGHRRPVTAARFSRDGEAVVSASADGTVRLWQADSGAPLEVLHGHNRPVTSIALSPDGDRIASGSFDRTVRLWDGQPGSTATSLQGTSNNNAAAHSVVFSADGTKLAWRPGYSMVRVTDARNGEDLFSLPRMMTVVRGIAFEPGGGRLLTVGDRDKLRAWDAQTGAYLGAITERLPRHLSGDFSPDRSRYAAGTWPDDDSGETPRVLIWSTGSGELTREWEMPEAALVVRFSCDGRRIASSSSGEDGRIFVRDVETGTVLCELSTGAGTSDMRFDPSGRRLAVIGTEEWDQVIQVWNVETGQVERELEGHSKSLALGFSPDGSRIATANLDHSLSLWAPERGEIVSLSGHADIACAVGFSPDGTRIASADFGGSVRIWETTPVVEREGPRREAARRRVLRRQARPLVDALFEELILPERVIERLQEDPTLSEDLLEVAIRLARCRPFVVGYVSDPPSPFALVWQTVTESHHAPDDYLRALEVMEKVVELRPDPDVTGYSNSLTGLGAAQFRMGRHTQALITLRRAEDAHGETYFSWAPGVDGLLMAMCHFALGNRDEAEPLLERARRLMASAYSSGDEDLLQTGRRLLAEAERMNSGG